MTTNNFTTVVDSYAALQTACSQGYTETTFAVPGWEFLSQPQEEVKEKANGSIKIFNTDLNFNLEHNCYGVGTPVGGLLKCSPMNAPHILLWVNGRRYYIPVLLLKKRVAQPVYKAFLDPQKQLQLLHAAMQLEILSRQDKWVHAALSETSVAISDAKQVDLLQRQLNVARLALLKHTKKICCVCGCKGTRVATFRCTHKCVCVRCSIERNYACIMCKK